MGLELLFEFGDDAVLEARGLVEISFCFCSFITIPFLFQTRANAADVFKRRLLLLPLRGHLIRLCLERLKLRLQLLKPLL